MSTLEMALIKHKNAGLKFNPTQEDREIVACMKACNIKDDIIRRAIINPETRHCLSIQTFVQTFKDELVNAKAFINRKCLNTLYEGLDANKNIYDDSGAVVDKKPDFDIRLKCIDKIRQLASKGVYEPKFIVTSDLTPIQEINAISKALREGVLNSYEADSLISAVKVKIDAEKEVDRVGGITIQVDSGTLETLAGVLKPQPE